MAKGLDVGTSFVVLSQDSGSEVVYKDFRDAFYTIKPSSPVAQKMIEKGLAGKTFVKDADGTFILLGQDAIEKAVERNDSAKRPMHRGVVSAKEKDAKRILAYILKEVAGQADEPGEKLVFCVPAQPVDQEDEDFDVGYHEDVVKTILGECGYAARAINEAEALCYSELENDDYTGVALSCGAGMVNCCVMLNGEPTVMFSTTKCLAKDTLVTTAEGLKQICDVVPGDICIDHLGNCVPVKGVLDNGTREILTKIEVTGYSEPIRATADHNFWIKKDGAVNWAWCAAEDIKVGDYLGIPIIKPKSTDLSRALYAYRADGNNITLSKSRELGQFLGYILGDGSAYVLARNESDGRVTCSFNPKHADYELNLARYKTIVKNLFDKDVYEEARTSQACVVCRFHSAPVAKFLRKLCYNADTNAKQLNIRTTEIPHQMALGVIEGLFATDGWVYKNKHFFENTSSALCLLLQDLLARFGIKTSFTVRKPRLGGVNNKGQQIRGKNAVYRVEITTQADNHLLGFLFQQSGSVNLPITDADFLPRRVSDVATVPYGDHVFDLEMASDTHSFSCPGGGLHNSGDWVDRMAAVATAEKDSVVQVEKEHGEFTIGQPTDNVILAAVSSYYERLIDYTTKQLAAAMTDHKLLPKFKHPLPVVIAGGTSQAKGFVELFRAKLAENNFPLPVSEVRHAKDALHAVARGCLVAAKVL